MHHPRISKIPEPHPTVFLFSRPEEFLWKDQHQRYCTLSFYQKTATWNQAILRLPILSLPSSMPFLHPHRYNKNRRPVLPVRKLTMHISDICVKESMAAGKGKINGHGQSRMSDVTGMRIHYTESVSKAAIDSFTQISEIYVISIRAGRTGLRFLLHL